MQILFENSVIFLIHRQIFENLTNLLLKRKRQLMCEIVTLLGLHFTFFRLYCQLYAKMKQSKSEVLNYDCHEMVLLFPKKAQSQYGSGNNTGNSNFRTCHCKTNGFWRNRR